MTSRSLFLAVAARARCCLPANAQPSPAGPVGLKLTPVLETATTITGQTIRFPQGDNQFTAVIAEVAPGGQVGRHMHPVPLFVYMLEGTLSIEMDGHGVPHLQRRPRLRRSDQRLAQRPQPHRQAGALPDRVLGPEGHAEPDPALKPSAKSNPSIRKESVS